LTQNPVSNSHTLTVLSRDADTKNADPAVVTSIPVVEVVVVDNMGVVVEEEDVVLEDLGDGMKQMEEIV